MPFGTPSRQAVGNKNMKLSLPALGSVDGLKRYLQDIRKFPVLSAEEEYMLAKRWQEHGDVDAAHKLVTSHLRLVAKVAMGYRGYGLPVGELISEGNIGMMQAVKKFDPERGFRLSTYAIWWIKAAMQEYILRSWSLVKIGTSLAQKKLFFNLRKLRNRIKGADEGSLSPDEISQIATQLDVSDQDVTEMEKRLLHGGDQSLNNFVGGDDSEGDEYIDFLADTGDNQETLLLEDQEMSHKRSLFKTAMSKLNPREQQILQARHLQEEPETLEVLSQKFNISRERVRQIEARAMEKLQAEVRAQAS